MTDNIKRPQRPGKRTQPAREAPTPVPDASDDHGDPVAIGLMIGIIAIIALLTLAMIVSIP